MQLAKRLKHMGNIPTTNIDLNLKSSLTLAVCNFLVPEVAEVIKNGDYPDVKLVSYPAGCNANTISTEAINKMTSRAISSGSDLIILSSSCYKQPDLSQNISSNTKVISLDQCFEPLINSDTIFHFISKGYYIASNGWLKSYDQHIKNWGFEKETAGKFFNESMYKILFLDTKIPGDYLPNLKALSEYMNLPYEIIPIGLTYCKMYIDSLVLQWRNKVERKTQNQKISSVAKKSADYSVIFNQLEKLVSITDENKIIAIGFELANILFAPSDGKYTKFQNSRIEYIHFNGVSAKMPETQNNKFAFDIYYSNEILGKFEINGFPFPQFIQQYEEMAKTIGQILGISIANARKYQVILEQKNQIEHYSKELQNTNNSKDKFFSIIAHDLKGPFNSLLGFSELLSEEIEAGDITNTKKFVSIIHEKLNETYNLLINLLEWAQSQTERIKFTPQKISIYKAVNEITKLFSEQAAKKNIKLEVNISEDFEVFADVNMLNTIFRNLVSNAIKFTKKNGKVTIAAYLKNNTIEINVKDTGLGMAASAIEKLFSIATNESTPGTSGEKGTGLGLILCKEFVEMHKGEIWVESELGNGSVFYFTIPYKTKAGQ